MVLDVVTQYERGAWDEAAETADRLGLDTFELRVCLPPGAGLVVGAHAGRGCLTRRGRHRPIVAWDERHAGTLGVC